jgi:hypothetical protein
MRETCKETKFSDGISGRAYMIKLILSDKDLRIIVSFKKPN